MFTDENVFEEQVLRLARQIWPASALYGGSTIIEGRERDGKFETEEMVHFVEATVSRSKQKAEGDISKLEKLAKEEIKRSPTKGVKGWFITKYEPTAEQRDVARRTSGLVYAISFDQFQSKLINASEYITTRSKFPFGSVRNPGTGSHDFAVDYVPLDLMELETGNTSDLNVIINALIEGQKFTLLGDYGAGKSTTLREIYLNLRKLFYKKKTAVFPLLLNLRDHAGQTDPSEAIERHARRVGFDQPFHLVRAWRAGYVVLMLDGFDELATAGWAGRTKNLQEIRRRSMELVRRFIEESPANMGMIVAGREHYFDSKQERKDSLGTSREFTELTLNEFTDEQIKNYLAKYGWGKVIVPDWLPSRPLLLGYLAARDLLHPEIFTDSGIDPAEGWDDLLTRICEREANIEVGIDAGTVRAIIERLATHARVGVDGLGPLMPQRIIDTFTQVVGYEPDERGMLLLQRLPGLGVNEPEDGSRRFIDPALVDAARAGDVCRFAINPFGQAELDASNWSACLDQLGIAICTRYFSKVVKAEGVVSTAIDVAINRKGWNELGCDLVRILINLDKDYSESSVRIENIFVNYLYLPASSKKWLGISFVDCYFGTIEIDTEVEEDSLPRFRECLIRTVLGRVSTTDLPRLAFEPDCVIESFDDNVATTAAILELSLPLKTKVLLTVIKKLYVQRGSGRKESALVRGLDHRSRALVPEVLEHLQSKGIAYKIRGAGGNVWLPVRSQQGRIMKIVSSPTSSSDTLLNL